MFDTICDLFLGILINPVKTFRNYSCQKPYKTPLAIIALSSLCLLLLKAEGLNLETLWFYFSTLLTTICYWLFLSFFVDLMAKMFLPKGNFQKILCLSALSFTPWIFLAPLKLLKNASTYTNDIAILLLIGIWIWTVCLQVLAISETYSIPRKNAIIILLIPFLGMILHFTWFIDFFVKLFQISVL